MAVGERQKSDHLEEVRPFRTRLYLPLAFLIIGVVLSIAAYFSVRNWEKALIQFTAFSVNVVASISSR